jgi:hypothetical protein
MIREFHAPQTKVLEGGTKDEIQMLIIMLSSSCEFGMLFILRVGQTHHHHAIIIL